MIVLRLGSAGKDDVVVSALVALLNDEDVALQAMLALRQQVGAQQARPHVERLLDSASPQVAKQASRELKKIDKQLAS